MENILVFLMTSVFPFCSGRFYLPWFYRGKKGDRNCTTGAKFSNIVAFLYLCKHPLCTGMTYLSMEQGTHRALCACASTASLTLKDTAEQLHVTFQGQTRGTLQAWAQRWALPRSSLYRGSEIHLLVLKLCLLLCGLVQHLLAISPSNEILATQKFMEKYWILAVKPRFQLQEWFAQSVGFLTYPRSEKSMFLSFAVFLLLAVVVGSFLFWSYYHFLNSKSLQSFCLWAQRAC